MTDYISEQPSRLTSWTRSPVHVRLDIQVITVVFTVARWRRAIIGKPRVIFELADDTGTAGRSLALRIR